MSKELEALDRIIEGAVFDYIYTKQDLDEDTDIVRQALKELKAIKEANPSEALESLDFLKNIAIYDISLLKDSDIKTLYQLYHFSFNTINQALIKSQEQEKVLEIIFVKRVDMWHLADLLEQTYEMYLAFCESEGYAKDYILTQQEFELVKKVSCGTGNTEGVR